MWTKGLPSGGFRGQAVTAGPIADKTWTPDTPAPSQPFLRPFPQAPSAMWAVYQNPYRGRSPSIGIRVVFGQFLTGFRRKSNWTIIPGRVAPGYCSPKAPTDPYLHFCAYVSSYHEL